MQAGVTHLLMCYHGNGRKENRRSIGHACVCLYVSLSKVNCCTPLLFTYVLIPILQTPKNKRSSSSSSPSVCFFFSCCASFIFLNVCDETHRTGVGPWHCDHPAAVLCSSPLFFFFFQFTRVNRFPCRIEKEGTGSVSLNLLCLESFTSAAMPFPHHHSNSATITTSIQLPRRATRTVSFSCHFQGVKQASVAHVPRGPWSPDCSQPGAVHVPL